MNNILGVDVGMTGALLTIDLPLFVYCGKKKIILNLNNYRNLHYRLLNDSKKKYKSLIKPIVPSIKIKDSVCLEYVYFHGNARRVDVANPCSIIDKYTCDALVSFGVLEDDNSKNIKKVTYIYGGVDKYNPRCVLNIMLES